MDLMEDIEMVTQLPQGDGEEVKFYPRKKVFQLPGDIPDRKPRGPGGFLLGVYDELNKVEKSSPPKKSTRSKKSNQSFIDPEMVPYDYSNESIEKRLRERQKMREKEKPDPLKSSTDIIAFAGGKESRQIKTNFEKLNKRNIAISSMSKNGMISWQNMTQISKNMENNS